MSLENRPDVNLWHTIDLEGEYSADSPVADLKEYLAVETRLFQQMEQRVMARISPEARGPLNRYNRGSLTDPVRWGTDWNRTFELTAAQPAAGVLLLHGMSDGPYSLRALGRRLNAQGAWVLGLRLPGHGTVPSGLLHVTWEDMAASVRLAMRHLRERLPGRPVFLVGYSTGGALAVAYALACLDDESLPEVEKMVLISPALGVSRLAALSVWQARMSRWLGLEKLAWNSIQPEYNAYKYNSFAINAGHQVYRLADAVRERLEAAHQSGDLSRFPPVLAFQSVVDATVSTPAVITGLFNFLDRPDHELIVFDINRTWNSGS
ncbi:alpha/beta hydrolase [Desulfosarcina alkanivorans]|uniref:alpha/beta hydrolase n=1 Tax=Desulfosarcina alkanivorans TaxID=571177 RepID=UPI0012D2F37B|nr:alpha/beta hydrolase [Desulfosarcina alkanivorans]